MIGRVSGAFRLVLDVEHREASEDTVRFVRFDCIDAQDSMLELSLE